MIKCYSCKGLTSLVANGSRHRFVCPCNDLWLYAINAHKQMTIDNVEAYNIVFTFKRKVMLIEADTDIPSISISDFDRNTQRIKDCIFDGNFYLPLPPLKNDIIDMPSIMNKINKLKLFV